MIRRWIPDIQLPHNIIYSQPNDEMDAAIRETFYRMKNAARSGASSYRVQDYAKDFDYVVALAKSHGYKPRHIQRAIRRRKRRR